MKTLALFGVVSRLRQVRSKALPCILKAGAFILARRSLETTPNKGRTFKNRENKLKN